MLEVLTTYPIFNMFVYFIREKEAVGLCGWMGLKMGLSQKNKIDLDDVAL